MNICFIEGDMSRRGGTEHMTAWLANRLANKHDVSIISLHMQGTVFYKLASNIAVYPLSATTVLRQCKEIRNILEHVNTNVVICVDIGTSYFGVFAAKALKIPIITWEHSNFYNNWWSRSYPYIRHFAARKSDAMVVLTDRDKHNYESNIKKCVPVSVIANPATKGVYSYDGVSKTILSAGLLSRIKRFDRIVPIGKTVFSRYPDWKWVICGNGPERENLERAVKEAGLQDNILFRGSVSDMDTEYAGAAMYVLTSEMEGLPMVLLEAKSHGLPIVSFDIETGPSDIVRDGVNGYLVKPGDIDAMAGKICELIGNDALRQKFSENAALDMEKFDEERIVKQWEALMRSL